MVADGGTVTWNVKGEQDLALQALHLRLVGPDGKVHTQTFTDGQPSIGSGLKDGVYKWETVAQPFIPKRIQEEMAAVRESGNFEAEQELEKRLQDQGYLPSRKQAKLNTQSGSFRILNGEIVAERTE